MNEVLVSAAVMLGISSFFGVVLALSHRFLHVEQDPRIETVETMLPGTNCGACGQPGCASFAESLVGGDSSPGQCTVSTSDGVQSIAAFLGVEAGFQEKRVARLHCAGGKSSVKQLAEYKGLESCRAAHIVNGGGKACPWGCLGLGDCEVACGFAAIRMNAEALPVVDIERCTACNDCVEVCPLNLFTLEPVSSHLLVQCSSPLAGELVRGLCDVACDACGRCVSDAEPGALEMIAGLPVIRDRSGTSVACTERCPTGAIQWIEAGQFGKARMRSKGTGHA